MWQASDMVHGYKLMTIVTDKACSYAKVIKEMNRHCGPEGAVQYIEGSYRALKQR